MDGHLSFRDSYNVFCSPSATIPLLKFIWKSYIPPKLSIIVWRIFYNKLPTDDILQQRGFYFASACLMYDSMHTGEPISHVFLQCSFAQNCWCWLTALFQTSLDFSSMDSFWKSILSKRLKSFQIFNLWIVACMTLCYYI